MNHRIIGILSIVCLVTLLFVRGYAQRSKASDGTPSPLLSIARNGSVLHSPGVTAIFWGPEWNDPGFAGDIVDGLESLLTGYSGSEYAQVATEYYDRTGSVTAFAPYRGRLMDPSAPPPPGGLNGSVAIGAVCRLTNNRPDPEDVYIVYTSTDKGALGGNWCGFHSSGVCGSGKNAVPVQAIGVPYATGEIGSGCQGVQDFETGHSLGLAQMANVTMHELVETITEPRGTGWHDGNGKEISDKCILTFPPMLSSYPVFSNGSVWKLQGLWSNAAYLSNSGVPNQLGQPACRW